MTTWRESLWQLDWVLVLSVIPLVVVGLATMNSFTTERYFFDRQLLWALVALLVAFGASGIDWRFLRRSGAVLSVYIVTIVALALVVIIGRVAHGAQSWFDLGGFSFQPADIAKLALILILAKYFSRRHIEIRNIRHIIISAVYAFIPFLLILLQPDFGSALVIFCIWLGLIMVSGISKTHLALVFGIGFLAFLSMWVFVFQPYQKARILTFVHPLADIRGAGYNAFQSIVAVGSGQWIGKGVGYGTQSRLSFLPEYQTDFIFSAYAEEWGFIGVTFLLILFGLVIWRIARGAILGATNFETLFGLGLAIMIVTHLVIHIGMNVGVLPVTGLPLPFVSYGGSHLVTEFLGLGMLLGMRRYSLGYHREDIEREFVGYGDSR